MALQHSLFNEPDPPVPENVGRAAVSERIAKSILTKPTGLAGEFDYTINPYVGCSFSCSYCFAANFVPDLDKAEAWGTWVEVKENALELLRKGPDLGGKRILFGSVTDPYQPVEMQTGLMRSLLEHISALRVKPRIVIQTRGPLVTRDIDLLQKIGGARVNMSITTDDEGVRKLYEPSCASIERRVSAVLELRDAGISTAVCVSPMLPISDPVGFAQRLKKLKADRYYTQFFHMGTRQFSSSTRKPALELAREQRWTIDEFERTALEMRSVLPELAIGRSLGTRAITLAGSAGKPGMVGAHERAS